MHFFQGTPEQLAQLNEAKNAIPVSQSVPAPDGWRPDEFETTLSRPFSVTGPATYRKGNTSILEFRPTTQTGWWLNRTDFPEQLPVEVQVRNVWTSLRNIVLRSGCPHNYMRMSEHIICQRLGMGLDNVMIDAATGDPPLFEEGSMPIVDGILEAGIKPLTNRPLAYWTVREPVTLVAPDGKSYLSFYPDEQRTRKLSFDVAIDFPTVIGKQRLQFDLTREAFVYGAHARTNCSLTQMRLLKYLGWIFTDTRHFGYNRKNILVAGKTKYSTEPKMLHEGRSLEAVWHRACLDLIAALSLIESGRLCGQVHSYRAGHTLDCRFMTFLQLQEMLVRV